MDAGEENRNLCQPNQVFTTRNAGDTDRVSQVVGGKFRIGVPVNPLTNRAQGLRGQAFRQTLAVRQLRRAAVQNTVDIRLLVILMRAHQLLLLLPAVQRFFKTRELERLNQIIHHPVMHRGLDRRGIRGRRNHDNVDRATRGANHRQQIQAVILLHIDIEQHQIDRLRGIINDRFGLVQRGGYAAAAKTLNPVNIQTVKVGHHGIIIDN
ncbi:hypothetical protein D3C76_1151020 [compost metagenome]